MGGQGGGVLADWIVARGRGQWLACAIDFGSGRCPAHRRHALLYRNAAAARGQAPVLALMPTPGDVDVVIAAELMEAGRSILRGLATPDKTLLITSTHRAYAVAEKEKPGEAIADPRAVNAAAGIAARRIIAFDMDAVARASGTVISAPILGALAGAAVLPFPRESFEKVIGEGGKGVAASLKGFAEGFARASANELPAARIVQAKSAEALPASLGTPELDKLLARVMALPKPAQIWRLPD